MDHRDYLLAAFKEMLALFALLAGIGAVVAGRYIAGGVILSVAAFLLFEEPITRWRRKFLGW